MNKTKSMSLRLAPADEKDLNLLVDLELYSTTSDAGRDALRRGIREIKKDRGIVTETKIISAAVQETFHEKNEALI